MGSAWVVTYNMTTPRVSSPLFSLLLLLLGLRVFCCAKKLPGYKENYVLSLEPKMEDCPNSMEDSMFTFNNMHFKKLDKHTIAVSGLMNLTSETEAPISAEVNIDQLRLGSYVTYLVITYDDICKDIGREDQIWSSIMTQINIKSCPISPRVISLEQFKLVLDDLRLGPEHLGRFRCTVVLRSTSRDSVENARPLFCQVFYTRVEKE